MTDEAKALVATPAATLEQHIMDPNIPKSEAEWWARNRIETQAREIERLRVALTMIAHHIRDESDPYEEDYWGCRSIARAALAGDSHD